MENLSSSLRGVWESFMTEVGGYLPSLAAALAILILGWLAALLVSKLVQAALRKTTIDNRIAGWVRGEGEEAPDIEPAIGKVVFWLLMIFVLVGFFQALKLTAITGPLNGFLNQIFEFAPRLLMAGLLLAVAWLVATGVRLVIRTALGGIKLDERVASEVGGSGEEQVSPTKMLAETVYWLIFLLFLPAILGALALEGLLVPVSSMVSKGLAVVPNLIGAVAIFLLVWFAARIVQRVVTNLLRAAGIDRWGEGIGLSKAVGDQGLSGLAGLVLYAIGILLGLILALDMLKLDAITAPASAMLGQIMSALPSLAVAAVVLIVAFIVAKVVGGLVSTLLRAAGFGRLLERLGLHWEADAGRASEVVGRLVIVGIMLVASVQALELLAFDQLAALVSSFILFLGNVLLGLVIFGLGLFLANLAATTIQASGSRQSGVLATAARAAILILAGAMALRQMNVAEDIINLAFGLLLGAVAVAAAVAFGIGGRDMARQQLERWSGGLRDSEPGDD